MRTPKILFQVLVLLLAVHGVARAQQFEAAPAKLICASASLTKGGGDPSGQFGITLTGRCNFYTWVESEDRYLYRDTWTVDFVGTYDYSTRKARERMSRLGGTINEVVVTCPQNPWAHALDCDQGSISVVHEPEHMFVEGKAPVSTRLIGAEARTSLAKWETTPSAKALLADWEPIAPRTLAAVEIVRPSGLVPLEGGQVELELKPLVSLKSTIVELEWAKIEKSKDPSLGKESWIEGRPANAPKDVEWSALPLAIPMSGVFSAGSYAVRAKMRGDPESSWTDWTRFVVAGSKVRSDVMRRAPGLR